MAGLTEKNKRAIPPERPRWYVYHLIDPRDSRVFYVGKGTGNRIAAHEAEARAGEGYNTEKLRRIWEIWLAGYEVERQIVAYFWNEQDAYNFELEQIRSFEGLTNASGVRGRAKGIDFFRECVAVASNVALPENREKWLYHRARLMSFEPMLCGRDPVYTHLYRKVMSIGVAS